jgi:pimeloyl-ACP methyl ester carboxylesterase
MRYLYLHGFASSPQSRKAQFMQAQLASVGRSLIIPDLNQNDFTHLTLSRQLRQVSEYLDDAEPVTMIGSSFGGLTAAWFAEQHSVVRRLVLMAPAFGFLDHWLPRLGDAQVNHWRETGQLSVYHYSAEVMLPLHYGFVDDALQYEDKTLQRSLPTLILHGRSDTVIPIESSRNYAASRPWVTLHELDSDHGLTDVQDQIWQAIQHVCPELLQP